MLVLKACLRMEYHSPVNSMESGCMEVPEMERAVVTSALACVVLFPKADSLGVRSFATAHSILTKLILHQHRKQENMDRPSEVEKAWSYFAKRPRNTLKDAASQQEAKETAASIYPWLVFKWPTVECPISQ